MSTRTKIGIASLAFAASLVALPAAAIPYTVTAWAPAGSAPVKITKSDAPTATYTGSGGGFIMVNQTPGSTQAFISWCVDIFQFIPGGTGQYTENIGATNLSAAIRNDLGRLATLALAAATTPGAGSGNYAAAFQLAIWEILYNRTSPYNLANGTFYSNYQGSNAAFNIASGWLNTLNTNPGLTSNYTMNTYLSSSLQDQITFVAVSEPGMLALLGLGLIGAVVARRQSQRRKS